MRTRIVLGICITLLVAGSLHAATRTFTGVVDQFWSNAGNWDAIPGVNDKARVRSEKPCILDYDAPVIQQYVGEGGTIGHLILVDGAQLSVRTWSIIGYNGGEPDARHTIEVLGGVLNGGHPDYPGNNGRFNVGREGYGHLIIDNNGRVNMLFQDMNVGYSNGGDGIVDLRGGVLNLGTQTITLASHANGKAKLDFSGGVMTQAYSDDRLAYINDHIADGTITAYGGVGEVVVDTDETPGTLAVRGLHPLKPFPSDNSLTTPGAVELSWTLPDPNVPGQPLPVDVYFTDDLTALQQFTNPAAMQVVNKQNVTSVVVQTQTKTRYYWAVDTYVDSAAEFPVIGPIFSFIADNLPPVVDAGNDVVTWLVDGVRVGNLDTTVTDQDAYTVQWTVVSEPDAVIDVQIANGNDDAEQHVGNGNMDLGSSDLELANEDAGDPATDEQVIGLRFVDVPLENGSLVADAYVEVEVDKVNKQGSGAPVNLIIEGELAPDAEPFENVANNITDRAVTTAQVKWSIPAWTEQDAKFQTPDISSIIMEINSQRFWAPGNAIVLILRDDKDNPSTGLREAESTSGEAAAAPLLHIDLAGGPVVIETPTAEDTNVTLSVLGEHVLQLEAFDGEYTSSDTVMIDVYRDGCEAAKSLPDYVPSPGDLNGDCVVDDADMALLQEDWLKDTSLTEEWLKVD